jgi:hypothetical protein
MMMQAGLHIKGSRLIQGYKTAWLAELGRDDVGRLQVGCLEILEARRPPNIKPDRTERVSQRVVTLPAAGPCTVSSSTDRVSTSTVKGPAVPSALSVNASCASKQELLTLITFLSLQPITTVLGYETKTTCVRSL